jgi:CRISPR/Cas system-associated exonuclease Cas4 (RecB family)
MIFPTVHRNGTSKIDLEQQYYSAIDALRAALKALDNATPNGRDYYPQGAGVINQAIIEHGKRVQMVHKVMTEMQEVYEDIISPEDEKAGTCPRCHVGSRALCECTFSEMRTK